MQASTPMVECDSSLAMSNQLTIVKKFLGVDEVNQEETVDDASKQEDMGKTLDYL